MRHHPLFTYFFLAHAISWIVFVPYVLADWDILQGNYTFFYIMHVFGPAIVAIIMTSITQGRLACMNCVNVFDNYVRLRNGICSSYWAFLHW